MHAPRTNFGVFGRSIGWVAPALLSLALSSWAPPAAAMPGFFIGKGSAKRVLHTSHVVVMRKGEMSAVSIQADYDGPLDPFAIVLAVPADVTLERVQTLKRDFVDRVEQMSAPRFHEFWEMDPCEPGPAEQEWERKLSASSESNFLGGGNMGTPASSEKKVDKELFLKVDTEFKEGEYKFSLLGEGETLESWAKGKGFTVPQGARGRRRALSRSGDEAPARRGRRQADRARRWRARAAERHPLLVRQADRQSSDAAQPLELAGQARALALRAAPRSALRDQKLPERVSARRTSKWTSWSRSGWESFTRRLHDMMLAKNPQAFINEYAWHTAGCGEPCANAPLWIHEILTLGRRRRSRRSCPKKREIRKSHRSPPTRRRRSRRSGTN